MELENLKKLVKRIEDLEKSEDLLRQVSIYLGPYDHEINGKKCDKLIREIHEHLNGFDDGE